MTCATRATPWRHKRGASLADLKARKGHDSARAAMIYQHATSRADHKIAAALTEQIAATREQPPAVRLAAPASRRITGNGTLMARALISDLGRVGFAWWS